MEETEMTEQELIRGGLQNIPQIVYLDFDGAETVYRNTDLNISINVEVEDGIVTHVQFYGGCNGNLQGLCRLVTGMKVADVIARLEGIRCNHRPTSCPDQLCQALRSLPTS